LTIVTLAPLLNGYANYSLDIHQGADALGGYQNELSTERSNASDGA
jgi:hypothetical protein